MIFRLLTFFSLLALAANGATLSGRVELRDSKDPLVRKKADYSGVIVWLEPLSGSRSAPQPIRTKMLQKDKVFIPHVLAVPVGSTVDFPNLDPIFHNAFSNYDGQVFDVGLYPPGTSRSVKFSRAGVVRIFCNIHSAMNAIVAVLDSAWYSTTAPDGRFEIRNVPAGDYQVKVFHERATRQTLAGLERMIVVGGEDVSLPVIGISETGYLAIPHKDKYGRDYKGVPEDSGIYPVTRK